MGKVSPYPSSAIEVSTLTKVDSSSTYRALLAYSSCFVKAATYFYSLEISSLEIDSVLIRHSSSIPVSLEHKEYDLVGI